MTSPSEPVNDGRNQQERARKRRRLTDPDVVLERLADLAGDFDQVREVVADLHRIRDEQRTLLGQLRVVLGGAEKQLSEINRQAQTAEQRSRQAGIQLDDVVARYDEVVTRAREPLQQLDGRIEEAVNLAEQAFQEWRTSEGVRAAEWRAQTEGAITNQIRMLSRQIEENRAEARAAAETVEQARERTGTMERALGARLADLHKALNEMAERGIERKVIDTLQTEIRALRYDVAEVQQRTRRGTIIAIVAAVLAVVLVVSLVAALGTSGLTVLHR